VNKKNICDNAVKLYVANDLSDNEFFNQQNNHIQKNCHCHKSYPTMERFLYALLTSDHDYLKVTVV